MDVPYNGSFPTLMDLLQARFSELDKRIEQLGEMVAEQRASTAENARVLSSNYASLAHVTAGEINDLRERIEHLESARRAINTIGDTLEESEVQEVFLRIAESGQRQSFHPPNMKTEAQPKPLLRRGIPGIEPLRELLTDKRAFGDDPIWAIKVVQAGNFQDPEVRRILGDLLGWRFELAVWRDKHLNPTSTEE